MSPTQPGRIRWLLAAATVVPILALAGLGVQIVRQARQTEAQRHREALSIVGGRLALDVERRLQDIESHLAAGEGVVLAADGPVSSQTPALLYRPSIPAFVGSSPSDVRAAEMLEQQSGRRGEAVEAFRALTNSKQAAVRAAALLGMGRVLRKQGDRLGALHAYDDLATLGTTTVAGLPAALVARHSRARLFEETHDAERLRQEATELAQLLTTGQWAIDRAAFEEYQDLIERWGGPRLDPVPVARTESAIHLWQRWRAGELTPRGRRVLANGPAPQLAIWVGGPDRPVAWLGSSAELDALLAPVLASQPVNVAGRDTEGAWLFGRDATDAIMLLPADTRLPFVLRVASTGPLPGDGSDGRLVLGSLSLAFVLIVAAAYGLYRVTSRELGLARQQREFVSAVSHEFRTPLTSMRHLTDLLATREGVTDERRVHYYSLLSHETQRLHRMVENLLSFGRIEAGAYAWRLESVDIAALVRVAVDDFRCDAAASARAVTCEIDDGLPAVRADSDALARAVWNLLENAAKYSEPGTPIDVFVRYVRGSVQVIVGDRGIGIAPEDRARIFNVFVRGADATRSRTRGVGIGLALVKRIVEAHGGSVKVDSTPGQGSLFTLEIPCPRS